MVRSAILLVCSVALAVALVAFGWAPAGRDVSAEPGGIGTTPTPCPTDTASVGTHCRPITPTPKPRLTWTIDVEPEKPRVGEEVKVTAFAVGPGGIPGYNLLLEPDGDDAPLRLTSEQLVTLSQLSIPVSWELEAAAVGQATLRIHVNYETTDCPGGPPECPFYFRTESAPTIELYVNAAWGDANCSNFVDAIDAAFVLQRVAELIASLGCEDAADVSGDGTVGATDAALVLQYVAGYVSSLSR